MGEDRQLASWLVGHRTLLDAGLRAELGDRTPSPASGEAEALRRFRSFLVLSLAQDADADPSLEGLRVRPRRLDPLLDAWLVVACRAAGPDAPRVEARLAPRLDRFRQACRATASAVRASGAPRKSQRRAVSAAIDRVADAFLAVDPDTGAIADANPAAGALLATTRDALVGAEATGFIAPLSHERWWSELDAIAEGADPRRFPARLRDAAGREHEVEASASCFATRRRTLALIMARPVRSAER